MADLDTFIHVFYRDDSGRIAEVSYRMAVAALDDGSNFDDVIAAADGIETKLDVLTEDHIEYYEIRVKNGGGGAAPNDAATNGNYAFVRTLLSADPTQKSHFVVPAWDTALYEEAKNGVLDAAFQTAATSLLADIVDPETGGDMDFEYAQARERKVFKTNLG